MWHQAPKSLKVKTSGPGLQRKPQGQLSQMIHVGLFASLLDVVQGFHLERRAPFGFGFTALTQGLEPLLNLPYVTLPHLTEKQGISGYIKLRLGVWGHSSVGRVFT